MSGTAEPTTSESVDRFRQRARAWIEANGHLAPPDYGANVPAELNERSRAWQRAMHDAGFAAIHWPTAYGGQGLSIDHHRAWTKECQAAGLAPILNMVGLVLAAEALLTYGTEAQKRELLPATARGEILWCQLFSEPGSGSDLASLSTTATLDGDTWVFAGEKVWTSTGTEADWAILMARSEPDATRHAGISFFVIDVRSPGVDIRPLRQMNGDAGFAQSFLDEARAPATALLGQRGQGWAIAMDVLGRERSFGSNGARALERRLDQAMTELPDGLDPVWRARAAERWVEGQAYLALCARGDAAHPSARKLALSQFRFDLAELAADATGADAMLWNDRAHELSSAPGSWFGGGTTEVQRNIIGERVLGLAREPRPEPAD
ncbi:MAG: acyl-CoA dehydrogenase family protein [Actinomycetota bacterium]